ncbi:MAG TPA: hypothetical protein VKB38_02105 [Terracidiphilus sp.]|nr:hypothetical protein [Terracidiphilus sp.]
MGSVMRLGDLLIQARRVSESDVEHALVRSRATGGRLGESLVAMGAIDERTLSNFINRIPTEPPDIAATGMEESELVDLLLKLIYVERLANVRQYVEAIKLPYHMVSDVVKRAVDRSLLQTLGARSDSLLDMAYSLTEAGRAWAKGALERSGYCGPAPVTLNEFCEQVNLQKPTNEVITMARLRDAVTGLQIEDSMLEQVGPALNSGRAILMYGPPGNGKTTVAQRFASTFHDVIYVPYALGVEGQIIRVFDPAIHQEVSPAGVGGEDDSFMRQNEADLRWVPCRRPFVVVGGELTLEMLDLLYDETGRFYEAPLHMKALGGCFLIDDFGRQLVSPRHLLNRWIVPLESRFDFLKLHTGKSFKIPFEELVIFSTNMDPEDLMDPAFLRRIPYKIEVGGPEEDRYRRILQQECARHEFLVGDPLFNYIIYRLRHEKGMDLAAYQPRFLVDQVVATCRFMEEVPHFEPRYIDYALDNLRVRRPGEPQPGSDTAASAGEPEQQRQAEPREPAQEIAPEPERGPEIELVRHTDAEPARVPAVEIAQHAEPEPAPVPVAEIVQHVVPEPAPVPVAELVQHADPEPAPVPVAEIVQQAEPEPAPIPAAAFVQFAEPEPNHRMPEPQPAELTASDPPFQAAPPPMPAFGPLPGAPRGRGRG